MQGVQVQSLVGDSTCHAAWPKDKQKIKLSSHHVVPGTSQVALLVKNLPAKCRRCKRHGIDPGIGKIPWRRKWQPIPVFLPGKSHGRRSLEGYSPWGLKE